MDSLKYPEDFPTEEFNQKIEEIVKEKPPRIEEKELQDFIYDALEKKSTCTIKNLMDIYNNRGWIRTIEKVMLLKGYIRSGIEPDIYIPVEYFSKKF